MIPLAQRWFDKPTSEKLKYYCGTVMHGYTPLGTYTGVLENTRDGNETIKITDKAMRADPPILPDLFTENRTLFKRFVSNTRSIATEVLASLSDVIGLDTEARFENSHRVDCPTTSSLTLLCYPKSLNKDSHFGHNKHTDTGTLTLLFTDQPGLEMLSPRSRTWGRVLPKAGHAVVNVGDTLRFLSGQRFRSAIHRVIPEFAPLQRQRLSIGYFLRAEDDKVFKDSEGRLFTAAEWHDHKYDNYKAPHTVQRTNSFLTSGMELAPQPEQEVQS